MMTDTATDDRRPRSGASPSATSASPDQRRRKALHGGEECYGPVADDPSSLAYYRGLYDYLLSTNFGPSERVGSVEVIRAGALDQTTAAGDRDDSPISGPETEIGLIRLTALLSFSSRSLELNADGVPILVPRGNGGISSYGDTAGLMLGMHHFNNGNGTVVREIEGINARCPIRFVADFYDSEASQTRAVDVFSRQILESPDRPPAALFGAWRSAVSVPLAILSGVYEIPQISPLSTSTELDDVTQYTHFSRLIPSDAGTARATVDYFRQQSPDLRHMGVLYVNDAYGSAFHQAIKESTETIEPPEDRISVKGSPFSYSNSVLNPEEIHIAVKTLADTGYRVFFGVFYDEHYDLIMESAVELGIVGPGYVWIISDGLTESYLNGRSYPTGSALAIASQGIGILKAEGGRETLDGDSGYDRFVRAWYDGQDDSAVGYYNCVGHPATNTMDDPSIYYQAEPGFFSERRLSPTAGAAFIYDSVMAMGMAACGLLEEQAEGAEEGASASDTAASDAPSSYFGGSELYEAFVRQNFEGASGNVLVDPATTSRDPKSAFFVLYNADGQTNEEDGTTTFTVQTVSHTKRIQEVNATSIGWVDMDGKTFVYSDGTTTFPPALPPLQHDYNYLSPALRGVGLTLAGTIFASAVFFAAWTFRHRTTRVVKASQPMFLQMITAGTIIMGATIITLSMDDRVASQRGCDVACMLNPWLLTYGFVIAFSSLFSKTWRINKIFHNPSCKRVKVTIKDVILPFFVLLTLNTIVLAVWTALSPLKWMRIPRDGADQFGRPIESYGTCMSETKDWAPYVAVILALNFTMVVLANAQAYRSRNISMEYSESKFIGIIMASILQACCIGLPLVVLAADEPAANFIVRSGIIFVICMSMLLLMFVPKMGYLKKWREEKVKKERLKQERAMARKAAMERAVAMGYTASTVDRTAASKRGLTGSTVSVGMSKENRRISGLSMGGSSHGSVNSTSEVDSKGEKASGSNAAPAPNHNGDKEAPKTVPSDEEGALKKVLEDDNTAGDLDVDEELAIVDAAETNLRAGVSPAPVQDRWGKVKRQVLKLSEDDDVHDDFSFDDSASTCTIDDGCMRIMNHPKAESREMRVLRAQVDHLKLEKLAMHDRIRALRSLLTKNGIAVSEDEVESLTGRSKESNRRLNPRIVDDEQKHTPSAEPTPQRGLDRTFSATSHKTGWSKPSMKTFASARFGPGALKSLTSVRFELGSNKSLNSDLSDDVAPTEAPGDAFAIEQQNEKQDVVVPVIPTSLDQEMPLEAIVKGPSVEDNGMHSSSNLIMIPEDEDAGDTGEAEEVEESAKPQTVPSAPVDIPIVENDLEMCLEREAALPPSAQGVDERFEENR